MNPMFAADATRIECQVNEQCLRREAELLRGYAPIRRSRLHLIASIVQRFRAAATRHRSAAASAGERAAAQTRHVEAVLRH